MFEAIRNLLRKKLGDVDPSFLGDEVGFDVSLADPPAGGVDRGHFSTNAAFVLAKSGGKDPVKTAEELKKYLEDSAPDFFEKLEIAGPGFINMWLTPDAFQAELEKINKAGENWGKPKTKHKGTVIVEYSQPNIAKHMHMGHIRSTIIGDAIANIYEFAGYKTVRWNYLGDWGTQFGKLIAAYKLWSNKEEVEKDPVEVLNKLYVKFHKEMESDDSLEVKGREEFKKLEDGDKENRKLWEWFKNESIKEFEEVYKILGVNFDVWIGESFYKKDLKKLTDKLVKRGVAKESEGALIVSLHDLGIAPGLIRKSDGATLYLTRDIANLQYRIKKYKPSKILYVVDNGQSLHFQQLFAIAEMIGIKSAKLSHVKFGLVLSEDMKRLSTREGDQVVLVDVIDESIERARAVVDMKQPTLGDEDKKEIARIVGLGALKYNDLSQNRMSDIAFDWDKMLSLEGNSGPYIQYTYARLQGILNKADNIPKLDAKNLSSPEDIALVLKLIEFPEVIEGVLENNYPNYLAKYIYDLAREVNRYYESSPVLKAKEEERALRLNLVNYAAETIKTGLGLLGIEVVEKM